MRKNKQNGQQNNQVQSAKKRNEMLSSVLSESVVETLLDEFAANKNFIGSFEGETAYIGLLFNVNDIGGLSKKTNRDEDKGALVEQIKSGRIKALITSQLLADECMIIVPDAITVEAMSEFSILSNVKFKVCYVTKSCKIVASDVDVQLSDVEAIFQYDDNAEDVFLKKGSHYFNNNSNNTVQTGDTSEISSETAFDSIDDDVSDNTVELVSNDFESEPADSQPDFSEDDDTFAPDESVDFTNEPVDEPVDFVDEPVDEYEDYSGSDDNYSDGDADYSDEEVEEISDEAVENTIVRRFYSNELGLEVTTEPFDLQFMNLDTYVPFSEDRGEGWLNEYLSNMSKDANAEMERMHKNHMFELRKTYLSLLSLYCEDVQKQLDIADEDTRYGQINKSLKTQRIEAKKNIDRDVSKRKQELEDAWQKKLNQVGEDAARMAQQQYRERFGEAHDAELFRIEPNLMQEIEDSYQDAVRMMNTDRHNEASKLLDYGINSILKEIADIYDNMVAEEQTRYKELQQNMLDFIESNRKDEVARIETLKTEQERTTKAAEVMQESTERINQMKADFEASRAVLKGEIDNIQRANAARLKQSQEDYEARLSDAKRQNEALQKRLDDLLVRYSEIDKNKELEFTARINELSNERDAWKDKCEHDMSIHKRSSVTAVFLTIIAVIAAIAIGFIAGYAICTNNVNNNLQNNVVATQVYTAYNDNQQATEVVTTQPTENTQSATQNSTVQTATQKGTTA